MSDLGRIFIPVMSAEYDQFHLFCHAGVTPPIFIWPLLQDRRRHRALFDQDPRIVSQVRQRFSDLRRYMLGPAFNRFPSA